MPLLHADADSFFASVALRSRPELVGSSPGRWRRPSSTSAPTRGPRPPPPGTHCAASELGIPVSVGVGRTKLMAKLASRAAKPDGLHVLRAERELQLRSTLPVDEVWGIGPTTRGRLAVLGVRRLADLDAVPGDRLRSVCGTAMARRLLAIRRGDDDAQVRPVSDRRQLTAEGSTSGWDRADRTPVELATTCAARLHRRAERAGLVGTELRVVATPHHGAPVTLRRTGLSTGLGAADLQAAAVDLLTTAALPPITGLRVVLAGLTPADAEPLALF